MNKKVLVNILVGTVLFFKLFVFCLNINADSVPKPGSLELPEFSVIDQNGIDMMSSLPAVTLKGAKIGNGDNFISYEFSNLGWMGFTFGGNSNHWGQFGFDKIDDPEFPYDNRVHTRVDAGVVHIGGQRYYFYIDGENYISRSDSRLSLEKTQDGWLFIKEDGKEYSFIGGNLKTVTHPNGFKLEYWSSRDVSFVVDGPKLFSASTNTGLQLSFDYYGAENNYGYSGTQPNAVMEDAYYRWYRMSPYRVTALNNTIEYCDKSNGENCNFTNNWPSSTYMWPNGFPGAAFGGSDSADFVVENQSGQRTRVTHSAIEIEGMCGHSPHKKVVEISAIQYPKDELPSVTYEYVQATYIFPTTYFDPFDPHAKIYICDLDDPSPDPSVKHLPAVQYSTVNGKKRTHPGYHGVESGPHGRSVGSGWAVNTDGGGEHIGFEYDPFYGSIVSISEPGKRTLRTRGYDSRVYEVNQNGVRSTYHYDSRGNLIKRIDGVGTVTPITFEAKYPNSCSNRKTCNQPEWTKDGNGNRIDYTYHSASGQVASVTLPEDRNGVRAQTRYFYAQKYAYYKQDNSGSIQRGPSPVWMLTKKSECKTGAASGNGCAISGDEVVTTYDYGQSNEANNLFLKSMTVTADGASRTICYQYDKYGNRIGETLPKANFNAASCP